MGQKSQGARKPQKMPGRPKAANKGPGIDPKTALGEIAELMWGAAIKSCDAHRRYSDLVKSGAHVAEQKAALRGLRAVDEILDEAVDLYEVACLKDQTHADDPWWHRANMVWRTAKEYLRHQAASNRLTRWGSDHGHAELRELNIEYELEASALLRMRHAVDSYHAGVS
jgi:hypothetical protein